MKKMRRHMLIRMRSMTMREWISGVIVVASKYQVRLLLERKRAKREDVED